MRTLMKPAAILLVAAALGAGPTPAAMAADRTDPAPASEQASMAGLLAGLTVTVDGTPLDGFAWDEGLDLTGLLASKHATVTRTIPYGAKVEVGGIPDELRDAVTVAADEAGVTATVSKDGYSIDYRFAYVCDLTGLTVLVDDAPLAGFAVDVHDYYDVPSGSTVRLDAVPSGWTVEPSAVDDGVGFTLTGADGSTVSYRFHHASDPVTPDDGGEEAVVRVDLDAASRGTGIVALSDGGVLPAPVTAAVKGDPQTADDVFAALTPGRYRLTFERADDRTAPLGMEGVWHERSRTGADGVFDAPEGSASARFMVGMIDNGRDMPESVEFDMGAGAWLDLPKTRGTLVLARVGDVSSRPSAETVGTAAGGGDGEILPRTGMGDMSVLTALPLILSGMFGARLARRRG